MALRDAAGRLTHFVGIERDMTEDVKLRDQLVHTERLSAIGELIAGVAHEINNPLQTIIGCTELMLDDAQASNRADLELVRKEAMRAGQICSPPAAAPPIASSSISTRWCAPPPICGCITCSRPTSR